MKLTKHLIVTLIEEVLNESKMRKITGPTLQAYLDPNFGLQWGTTVDKQLKTKKILIAAANASGYHGKKFPEAELINFFAQTNMRPENIEIFMDSALNAYKEGKMSIDYET